MRGHFRARYVRLMGVVLVALLIASSAVTAFAQRTQFITIATGGTAGVYYPLGGAMAEIFNQNVRGVNVSVQATGASVANVNMIAQGQVELALIQNDIAFYAANAQEMFQNRIGNLRGITTLYPEVIQLVARADAGIRSIADLRGKRVAVGDAGSGTEANARQILAAAGLTYNDITVRYLSFAEAANNLRDGHIEAAFVTAGIPTAAIQDIAAQRDIVIVPIGADLLEKLRADYPFYTGVVIPGGTYRGVNHDVHTVAVKAMLVARADLSEDLVYNMTKAFFSHLDRMAAAHAAGRLISLETALDGMPIELHPGAARYYAEVGR